MIILASQSPRRKELLSKLINEYEIIPSDIDESLYPINELSLRKAMDIAKKYPNDIIIAADTLVYLDNEILGKPHNENEAIKMLKKLSNRKHEVKTLYTIYCLNKKIEITKEVVSEVYFNDLSDELISSYVKSKSPLDKAGAYGVQDNERFPIINKTVGSFSNIVGLPIEELEKDLRKINIIA